MSEKVVSSYVIKRELKVSNLQVKVLQQLTGKNDAQKAIEQFGFVAMMFGADPQIALDSLTEGFTELSGWGI